MPFFERDGLRFHYRDEGEGLPVFLQHELGGDSREPVALLPSSESVRLIALDARAHGETRPLGDPKKIAFVPFADDLVALLDHLGLASAVVGGISMGAAVALCVALREPGRVRGLVLSQPAWLDRPLPENVRIYATWRNTSSGTAKEGLTRFRQTPEFEELLQSSPESAAAVILEFEEPRAEECVARLERIPHDAPCHDRSEWESIRVPALVLGSRHDPIHPWDFAQVLAQTIPHAELVELSPFAWSPERHSNDFRRALESFLARHFNPG